MSHEITQSDGLALAGSPAWHGLGTVLPSRFTAEEGAKVAGLNWRYVKAPLYLPTGHPTPYFAVQRSDTGQVFQSVSKRYVPLQPREMLEVAAILAKDGARVESCGSLAGGETVFFLVAAGDYSLGGDAVRTYHLVTSSAGGGGWGITPTEVRVVCRNTWRAAVGARRLAAHVGNPFATAQELARSLVDFTAEAQALADTLASKPERPGFFLEVSRAVWGEPETQLAQTAETKRLMQLWQAYYHRENYAQSTFATLWHQVQSVGFWADWRYPNAVINPRADKVKRVARELALA